MASSGGIKGLEEFVKNFNKIIHGKQPDAEYEEIITEPKHTCTVILKGGQEEAVTYCVKKDLGEYTVFYDGYERSLKIPIREITRFNKNDIASIKKCD